MRAGIRMGMAALVFVVVSAGSAAPQDAPIDVVDARWTPWLGCWHLWEEQLDPGAQPRDDAPQIEQTSVCVTPAGNGVVLTAAVRDDVLVERRLIADGVQRPVDDGDCTGWKRSEWSRDGQRLFTSGEIKCADAPQRQVSGVSLMASTSSWVDIQLVSLGERQQLEVRRYAPTPPSAASNLPGAPASLSVEAADIVQARRASTEALVLLDVLDASEKTAPRVVESLLMETEPNLNLDSDAVIALDDAGISHNVIDLLVALSYPEHFVVQRRNGSGGWSGGAPGGFGGFGAYYDPIWYGDLYPYYVTPFGSRVWGTGYYPYFIGGYASPFLVLPSVDLDVASGSGRAYRNYGYTRVSPRVASPAQSGSGGSSGGTGGRRVGTGGSSGRGVATAGGGYSGGGGGATSTGSGRTAVPR